LIVRIAGIWLLSFVGVLRDGFGRYGDRFVSTVVVGCGLLVRAVMLVSPRWPLVWSQPTEPDEGGLHDVASGDLADDRLDAVWLMGLTCLAAITVLFARDLSRWVRMAFPVGVLTVTCCCRALASSRHFPIDSVDGEGDTAGCENRSVDKIEC
jgi:hypothetical protein